MVASSEKTANIYLGENSVSVYYMIPEVPDVDWLVQVILWSGLVPLHGSVVSMLDFPSGDEEKIHLRTVAVDC